MTKEGLAPVLRVGDTVEAAVWYQRLGFELQLEHSRGPNWNRTDAVMTRGELRLILSQGDPFGNRVRVVSLDKIPMPQAGPS